MVVCASWMRCTDDGVTGTGHVGGVVGERGNGCLSPREESFHGRPIPRLRHQSHAMAKDVHGQTFSPEERTRLADGRVAP